jgi:hypothetical protein
MENNWKVQKECRDGAIYLMECFNPYIKIHSFYIMQWSDNKWTFVDSKGIYAIIGQTAIPVQGTLYTYPKLCGECSNFRPPSSKLLRYSCFYDVPDVWQGSFACHEFEFNSKKGNADD